MNFPPQGPGTSSTKGIKPPQPLNGICGFRSQGKNWLDELGKKPPQGPGTPSTKGIKPPDTLNTLNGTPTKPLQGANTLNTLNGTATRALQGKTKADKRLPDRDRWLFVCLAPFTRTDIEAGAAGGTGPLDSDDVADIERGHYLTENRQQYLRDLLNNHRTEPRLRG
jgi:hypothetical protein